LLLESNAGPTEAQLVDCMLAQLQLGSVVSLRLGGHHMFEALMRSSTGSSRASYTLTTLSDLLGH
jgi:hypothetical protein